MCLGVVLCLAGVSSSAGAAAPAAPAVPVPMESFARLSAIRHVSISPDGKTIAYSVFADLQTAFAFRDLATGKTTAVESALGVTAVNPRWVTKDRVVYGGMSAINREGNDYAGLLGTARQNYKRDQNRIISGPIIFNRFSGDQEGNVLMLEYDQPTGYGRYGLAYVNFPNVINMDTRNANYFQVIANPGKVIGWLPDGKGVLRVAVEWDKGLYRTIYRESEEAPWHVLPGMDYAKRKVGLRGVSADGNTLYLSLISPTGHWGVYTYDLVKQRLGSLILSHDRFDILPIDSGVGQDGYSVEQIVFAPKSREVLGVQYVTELPRVVWFDPQLAAVQGALDQGLPNRANTVVSMSDDLKKLVVLSWSAKDPGTYYLFDLDKKELKPLFPVMPWIKPDQMAEVFPISYKSRDGLVIHGYLTVPPGKEPKHLPLIVYPHGGPFVRDSWAFDHDAQFLASRGYAVLQMNYRGSPGFGEPFFRSGNHQIGRGMQDDITDGTRWAIAQGIADPGRIAIMGWSFGGYSVLMGVTREPDLYRCGIDLAGVTDWRAILKYDLEISEKLWKEDMLEKFGDPEKDAAELAEASPVNHMDKLRVPLLLAYSKDDKTVPYDQVKLLTDALDKAHKSYEFMSTFNEGHGFYTYKRRLELYQRIDKFLAANMTPVAGPAPAAAAGK